MKIQDLMTYELITVPADTSIREAAHTMARHDVGFLPVLEGDSVEGLVTDRDIVVRAVAQGLDPDSTPVRSIMTDELWVISQHREADDVAQVMKQEQIRRVLVMNDADEIAGIVSLGDLAVHGDSEPLSGATLERISEPARPAR